ncbi:hypothetical protein JW826_04800 [Candidatus Woesearchaeota archaeon]|nr:hypothetical protein [Candidatus Woesearchaeota archaeon]
MDTVKAMELTAYEQGPVDYVVDVKPNLLDVKGRPIRGKRTNMLLWTYSFTGATPMRDALTISKFHRDFIRGREDNLAAKLVPDKRFDEVVKAIFKSFETAQPSQGDRMYGSFCHKGIIPGMILPIERAIVTMKPYDLGAAGCGLLSGLETALFSEQRVDQGMRGLLDGYLSDFHGNAHSFQNI